MILTLDVGPMAHGGHCVARYEGRVVFVRHAIPGETVRARVTEAGDGAKFWRADVVEVLQASDYRRRHIWKLADSLRAYEMDRLPVGGAEFGHITDQHQRRLKAQVFRDTLQRLGGIPPHQLAVAQDPADGELHVADVGEPHSNGLHWRTRVTFAVSPDGLLCMKPHRSHELIELRGMPLAVPPIHESGIFSADFSGALRVDAVAAGGRGPLALVVHADGNALSPEALQGLRERLAALAGLEIGTVILAVVGQPPVDRSGAPRAGTHRGTRSRNGRPASRRRRPDAHAGARIGYDVIVGPRAISEPLPIPAPSARGPRHAVALRPEGFWQIHRNAPRALVDAVAELAEVNPGETVADLYAGAGLFTAWAAREAGEGGAVLSVEAAEASHCSAQDLFSGTAGVELLRSSVERALGRLTGYDVVVLDPPRAGAGKQVVAGLDEAAPGQIVYVSCEPSAFARDAKELLARGWRMVDLRLLDLYPNTHHMESVALFRRG